MDLQAVKAQMRDQVAAHHDVLVRTSHQIHEHPELNYEERFAHDVLSDVLESAGIAVERHAYGLETAFVARTGTTGPTIAVLCEYDALPGLGARHSVVEGKSLSVRVDLGGRRFIQTKTKTLNNSMQQAEKCK